MYKQVTIKVHDDVKGNTSLQLDPMDTVSVIKDQLAQKKQLAYDSYELKLGAHKLDDESTLLESNLHDQSTILVSYFGFKVKVEKPAKDTAAGKEVKILEATYGGVSVVDTVTEMYKNGVRKFKATNSNFGDTQPNVVKFLFVKWEFDGKVQEKKVKEHTGHDIELPEGKLGSSSQENENTLEVSVNPTETITTMKTKIADKTGIDIEKFKLKLNGKDLSDESLTISEAKITKDSVLKIVLKKITLVVTTNDNKVITITIAVSEKISHLKGIISQKGGIAMDRFFLRLGNGVELIETKTLEESGIHSYSSLMIIYYKVQVTITIYKPGFQPPIVVTLDIMDTIADLKDRIKEKDALDSSKYVLKSGQEELDDGKTMDSIIKEQKSIRIVFKSILLTVNGKNKVFTMTVFWADTISKIKERIHKLDQTPIDRTQLKFGGVVLKGSKTVEECGLKDGSALKLVYTTMKLHYQMHDDPEGAKQTIMMDASNKIEAIKDEIEEKSHIESDVQILKFNGRVLDDKKSIRDEELHEDATLVVEKKKTIKDIKIPKPSGHGFYEIKIDISKTIYDLRSMIHTKYGIDLSKFKIKIGGKVIEDTTVIETTQWETQTISFVYIRMTLTVTTSDGQTVIVQINPHDKVISLKQMIGG